MSEETVTIAASALKSLVERDRWLSALENAGVDNWLGIEYAYELLEEEDMDLRDLDGLDLKED